MRFGLMGLLLLPLISWSNTTLEALAALEQHKTTAVVSAHSASELKPKDAFAQSHVLVLFFSSTCHFCQNFSPVVHQWATQHHYDVMPYTTNGESLPDFPHALSLNPELQAQFFEKQAVRVPALFILNVKTGQAYPVSVGGLTNIELDSRLQTLVPKITQYEQGGVR